jgi:hypothetical protein
MGESDGEIIMHIALPIGPHTILMGSDWPEAYGKPIEGTNVSISISANSKEQADKLFNGLSAGGQATMPMSDTFWGSYLVKGIPLCSNSLYDSTDERVPDFTQIYGRSLSARNYTAEINKRVWYHKYLDDYFLQDEAFNTPINFRALRFADVLLMYAEALNNLNRTGDANVHDDRVRQRSGMSRLSVTRPGMTQAQFQQQLEHERITELTGESVRWNDLARWGYLMMLRSWLC